MKILLAPSEGKQAPSSGDFFDYKNLFFTQLHPLYKQTIDVYNNMVLNSSINELSSWMGLKNLDEVAKYKKELNQSYQAHAIQVYTGEAFKALDYNSLNNQQRDYILQNTLIHSNLFGILRAFDSIPTYKFKQDAKINNTNLNALFKENLTPILDEFLKDEIIIDLRAKHYEKFYIPKSEYIVFEFYKNNKQVSHFSKVYRGLALRYMAQNNITTKDDLDNMQMDKIKLLEIAKIKNKTIYKFDITS